MKLLLMPILVAAIPVASPSAAGPPGCADIVDGARIRVQKRPFGQDIPDRDRFGYPDARTMITCRIVAGGRLTDCRTPLTDKRGPWLVKQLRLWKVLGKKSGGCPLIGRRVRFNFRLEMSDKEADGGVPGHPPGG